MQNNAKILLTHGYFIEEDEKEAKIMKPYPPLGILYLSAWLDQHQLENNVYDTTFSNFKKFNNFLENNEFEIVGLYTNLMTKLNVIKMVSWIKERYPKTKIAIGGPDVTHNLLEYLQVGCDFVVFGEGEQTMLELCQKVTKREYDYEKIDGIAFFLGDGSMFKTNPRKRIRPIDDLPFPNRKKIDMTPYLDTWKQYHGKSAMTVSTQRGCPYTCKWCSTAVYGQSYRRRSPELVAKELKHLKQNFNPDSVWFVDDVFTVSHKWLEQFANAVNEMEAIIPFECITRADRMNEDVVQMLKKAGCFRIWIGAESGSQKVIDLMDRRVDVNQVRNMIQLTRHEGMEAGTFIMLGYPGETEEDIIETVHHLKTSNPHFFTITIAYPIKGTSLFNEVEADQTKTLDWNQSTDRDRDFKRPYSRKYYEYAVKWVDNEVRAFQKWPKDPISASKHKLKSIYARSAMRLNR